MTEYNNNNGIIIEEEAKRRPSSLQDRHSIFFFMRLAVNQFVLFFVASVCERCPKKGLQSRKWENCRALEEEKCEELTSER